MRYSVSNTVGALAPPLLLALLLLPPPPCSGLSLSPLPVLHNYDHCPYCVRVRFALGVKGIKHRLNFLPNDDVETPTALIGRKIAPIFEYPPEGGGAAVVMGESLDIIEMVDSDVRWGPPGELAKATGRDDLKAWQKSVQTTLRLLQRPRYVASGALPEFHQRAAREAFVRNHQLPPYEKKDWKNTEAVVTNEEKMRLYAEALVSPDSAGLIEELNGKLVELDGMVTCADHCSEGGLGMDDVDLWSRLRSVTIIKGVRWPDKLRAYMDNLSERADVPLYDQIAI